MSATNLETKDLQKEEDQEDINALSGNKVGVEIEPDVKAIQLREFLRHSLREYYNSTT